jgi:hypothetical protein
MPGPRATIRIHRPSDAVNEKTQARLKRRVDDYMSTPNKERLSAEGLHMHKPGSQNRKK